MKPITKIVSGGQTGADCGGLEFVCGDCPPAKEEQVFNEWAVSANPSGFKELDI